MSNSNLITKEGLDLAKSEMISCQEKRKEIIEQLVAARALGDLRENGAYQGARKAQEEIDKRISYLENIILKAKMVDLSQIKEVNCVTFGSSIKIKQDDKVLNFKIVGDYESDISKGKISINSPIIKACLGAKIGKIVIFEMPNGSEKEIEILDISI